MSGDVIELLIYHQPSVKPSLTLHPFGVLGYVAGHSLTGPVFCSLSLVQLRSFCSLVTGLSNTIASCPEQMI